MRLRFSNAVVLEGEELEPVRGSLEIEDNRIARIGADLKPGSGINLKGAVVLPPFVNAHTHLADSGWKELYLGRTQREVVGPKGIKFQKLERGEKWRAVRASLQEMRRGGTALHLEFREGGVQGVEFMRRITSPPPVTKILGRGKNLDELRRVLRVSDGIGIPSLDAVGEKTLSRIAEEVRRKRKFFAVHVDETEEEHQKSVKVYGKGELQRALELNPSAVVHATHADPPDLELAKRRGVPVVFCVRSNSLLGSGAPPLALAIETGVEFWLGTDNGMVCEPNMFEELQAAWQCIRRQNPRAGSEEARGLLKAATVHPLMRFKRRYRGIEKSGEASFMVLARGNNLRFLTDLYGGLVNRARVENVVALVIEGSIVKSSEKNTT